MTQRLTHNLGGVPTSDIPRAAISLDRLPNERD
jgi:hypothetical protein